MVAEKGNGLLMGYSDVAAENDEEYNRWYNEEHIPERLSIPGVLNAARYEAVQGGPKYLACYELESADTWHSNAWQKWLNEPTEWSKRMSPSVIGTAYIRNLYTRIYPDDLSEETAQSDMAPVLLPALRKVLSCRTLASLSKSSSETRSLAKKSLRSSINL